MTIDTEAALLVSRQSLSRVVGSTDPADLDELRDRVRVTAVPNTGVLLLEVRDQSGRARAEQAARWPAPTSHPPGYLSNRRDQALALLREQLAEFARAQRRSRPRRRHRRAWSGP